MFVHRIVRDAAVDDDLVATVTEGEVVVLWCRLGGALRELSRRSDADELVVVGFEVPEPSLRGHGIREHGRGLERRFYVAPDAVEGMAAAVERVSVMVFESPDDEEVHAPRDLRTARGLDDLGVLRQAALIAASVDDVVAALAPRATRIERQVLGREIVLTGEDLMVFRLEGQSWTHVIGKLQVMHRVDWCDVSRLLATRVLECSVDDHSWVESFHTHDRGVAKVSQLWGEGVPSEASEGPFSSLDDALRELDAWWDAGWQPAMLVDRWWIHDFEFGERVPFEARPRLDGSEIPFLDVVLLEIADET